MKNYIEYLESLGKKQLMVLLARQRREQSEPVAIVGMGCRLPGGIDNPQSFWRVLREGQVIPIEKNKSPVFSDGSPRWNFNAPDLTPLKDALYPGRYLDDVDLFDAAYFGLQDEEVKYIDPQQRLLMEVTVQALADANITRRTLQSSNVGIFVGLGFVEYPLASLRNGVKPEQISHHLLNGSSLSAASGRLGVMLGVNGPAMTIDTASSSGLCAVHLAIQSLRQHECDIAIVGVCHLQLSPFTSIILANAGVVSSTGNSLPFTNSADGFVRSEGCGVIILKRYSDAKTDLPYAMIRGSAVHQHGDRLGLSVASAMGQQTVIRKALKNSGVEPNDVNYIEAQANGIRLGCVVETEAIAAAYERLSPESNPLYIGSCKANIGYLEIASGMPGIMKVALALSHGELPPQIGADDMDTTISWDSMSLQLVKSPLSWPVSKRRIAGVNAFGVNGINAHVVIEDVPMSHQEDAGYVASEEFPTLLALSAHTPDSFCATAARLEDFLIHKDDWNYQAVCRTLIEGRETQKVRQAAVVSNRGEILKVLSAWKDPHSEDNGSIMGVDKTLAVNIKISNMGDDALRFALAFSRNPSMIALKSRIDANLETMSLPSVAELLSVSGRLPEGVMMAWAAGWIQMIKGVGIEIIGAEIGGLFKDALLGIVIHNSESDNLLSQWQQYRLSGKVETIVHPGWTVDVNNGVYRAKRQSDSSNDIRDTITIILEELDTHAWLRLVGESYRAGKEINLTVLRIGNGMMRLPGPVLLGKSYWPEQMKWH